MKSKAAHKDGLNKPVTLSRALLYHPVYVVNVVAARKEIENSGAFNAVILSEIKVISNAFDDFSFAQHMAVMGFVFQAVNVCGHFHVFAP
jgi:hypothetical protein